MANLSDEELAQLAPQYRAWVWATRQAENPLRTYPAELPAELPPVVSAATAEAIRDALQAWLVASVVPPTPPPPPVERWSGMVTRCPPGPPPDDTWEAPIPPYRLRCLDEPSGWDGLKPPPAMGNPRGWTAGHGGDKCPGLSYYDQRRDDGAYYATRRPRGWDRRQRVGAL